MNEIINDVLVIKVGTNTLLEKQADGSERLDIASFARIGQQVLALQEEGKSIVIVSSGAITAGMVEVGLHSRPRKETEMTDLQRLASIGWRHVLNRWGTALQGRVVGELLLTRQELGMESERKEALSVMHALLRHSEIAVINENDAISHVEIAFGDNDTLAATIAAQIRRSKIFGNQVQLVLLSDIDGVYADLDDRGSVLRTITNADQYLHLAQDSRAVNGTGGMVTKFAAAEIANKNGVDMYIANGRVDNAIALALAGQIGTRFIANQ